MGELTEWTACPDPDCRFSAEVTDRYLLHSTDGMVEHMATRCPAGHCFNGAVESLGGD